MQKYFSTKEYIITALIAAIYVVSTLLLAPISYGIIQFRLSEILNHLLVYNKKFIVALTLGVFIANFWSPFALYDIIFGTGATFLCSLISIVAFKYIKHKHIQFIFNTLNFSFIGMVPITLMIIALGDSNTFFAIYFPLVLSELIILGAGQIVLHLLHKKINLSSYLNDK
ncbi:MULTISPECIES: QueT transporter family protein [unclassified Granulicatella]|uniref:QueT transporter family protein n=1 Tax=unclassified Granulicatella TaxID=2630493 RepID=UPI0010738CFD|nr:MULTISPECIES: QueT transporter family protein [unclassified Granulicatella]MBF0779588.1 QueT transporter family protein [Granulicatella sp. 19428wC4_WM01]TFU96389.1 QueT transporter family protein [Granulicatella sp. WM01]